MSERWLTACFVVILAGIGLGLSERGPARPIVASKAPVPGLYDLETNANRAPGNAHALSVLAEAYLASDAPGAALSAIDRAPATARTPANILDARARALLALGNVSLALNAERDALTACAVRGCEAKLEAHARRRERWLSELVALRVEDVARQPERALIAYRLSAREVHLDSAGTW